MKLYQYFKFLPLDENFRSSWIDRVLSNGLLNCLNLMEMYILISFIFLLHLQLCYEKSFFSPSTFRLESLLTGIKETFHSALVSDLKLTSLLPRDLALQLSSTEIFQTLACWLHSQACPHLHNSLSIILSTHLNCTCAWWSMCLRMSTSQKCFSVLSFLYCFYGLSVPFPIKWKYI